MASSSDNVTPLVDKLSDVYLNSTAFLMETRFKNMKDEDFTFPEKKSSVKDDVKVKDDVVVAVETPIVKTQKKKMEEEEEMPPGAYLIKDIALETLLRTMKDEDFVFPEQKKKETPPKVVVAEEDVKKDVVSKEIATEAVKVEPEQEIEKIWCPQNWQMADQQPNETVCWSGPPPKASYHLTEAEMNMTEKEKKERLQRQIEEDNQKEAEKLELQKNYVHPLSREYWSGSLSKKSPEKTDKKEKVTFNMNASNEVTEKSTEPIKSILKESKEVEPIENHYYDNIVIPENMLIKDLNQFDDEMDNLEMMYEEQKEEIEEKKEQKYLRSPRSSDDSLSDCPITGMRNHTLTAPFTNKIQYKVPAIWDQVFLWNAGPVNPVEPSAWGTKIHLMKGGNSKISNADRLRNHRMRLEYYLRGIDVDEEMRQLEDSISHASTETIVPSVASNSSDTLTASTKTGVTVITNPAMRKDNSNTVPNQQTRQPERFHNHDNGHNFNQNNDGYRNPNGWSGAQEYGEHDNQNEWGHFGQGDQRFPWNRPSNGNRMQNSSNEGYQNQNYGHNNGDNYERHFSSGGDGYFNSQGYRNDGFQNYSQNQNQNRGGYGNQNNGRFENYNSHRTDGYRTPNNSGYGNQGNGGGCYDQRNTEYRNQDNGGYRNQNNSRSQSFNNYGYNDNGRAGHSQSWGTHDDYNYDENDYENRDNWSGPSNSYYQDENYRGNFNDSRDYYDNHY